MTASIVIAAPYPEGGAVELARAAERLGRLSALMMPSRRPARTAARVAEIVGLGDAGRRLRRGAAGVRSLEEIDPFFELARLAAGLPGVGRALPDIHRLKAGFDRRVAAARIDAPVVVSMPESALATFSARPDLLRVFHEVDGHPRARNDVLAAHYGAREAARESHPAAVVERIEGELALADVILSPSAAVTRQMIAHGVPPGKLVQAHLGVDLSAFGAPAVGASARGGSEPVLLYVGQISLRKGITFLLDAARGRRVRVRLLGPVVDAELLRDAPSNVEHVGVASPAGVAAEMRTADAFVLPTLEDAFGLVVVEAAASGLPVISTDGAGAAEVLGPEDVRIVPIGDATALGEAMAAVEPLLEDARLARAERMRHRVEDGSVNDWTAWSDSVLAAIDARLPD